MSDLVRVKAPGVGEFTTDREHAEARGFTITDKPATYDFGQLAGQPLPPKPSESIAEKAASKAAKSTTSAAKAANSKEA